VHQRPAEPPRILLVEDNAALRAATEEVLRSIGARTTGAASGAIALGVCEREDFDLILMDLEMPGLDGYKACAALQARLAERCPPVVALSARLGESERRRCLAVGMVETVQKPVDADRLERLIKRWASDGGEDATPPSKRSLPPSGTRGGVSPDVLARLAQLESRVGPPGWVDQLIQSYRDSAVAKVRDMESALAVGDVAAFAESVHALNSDASSLGALRMARLCGELEQEVRLALSPESSGSAECASFSPESAALFSSLKGEMSRVELDLCAFQKSSGGTDSVRGAR
jgi:CheY-like chemotaxis protein